VLCKGRGPFDSGIPRTALSARLIVAVALVLAVSGCGSSAETMGGLSRAESEELDQAAEDLDEQQVEVTSALAEQK
jgi:uncharacterized lipoprotein